MKKTLMALMMTFSLVGLHSAFAEETVGEKAAEVGRDIKKNTKKAGRNLSDKTCEMVNGKMQCLGKKMKHKAQNAVDEVKDKADDITH